DYTVTSTGLILLPLVGAVEVSGLTEKQAQQKVAQILIDQKILQKATVTLKIKTTPPKPISISGAITNPGEFPYQEGTTLGALLDIAKPLPTADLKAIRITHLDGTTEVVDVTRYANPKDSPKLRPGDRVFVPLQIGGQDIAVLGAVRKPGIVPFQEGITLRDAIEKAGGIRPDGDASNVLLTSGGKQTTVNLNEANTNPTLHRGDRITVPVRASQAYIYVRGAVSRPGLMPFEEGLTLSRVLYDAGPVEGARLDKVKVLRKKLDQSTQTFTLNFPKITAGTAPDFTLSAGDIVDVPFPAKSYSTERTLQVVGALVLLFFLFRG
ncbi:MAG: SLBB domain-containing protein, partial [Fimbriimonadales bacterium]|nr:SLBB domain-containing protein [Fimbriimonadales bacterium]